MQSTPPSLSHSHTPIGIMESADIILVNKTDGDLIPLAMHTKADYSSSLKYMRNKNNNYKHWNRRICCTSSKDWTGFDELYDILIEFYESRCDLEPSNSSSGGSGNNSNNSINSSSTPSPTRVSYLELKRSSQDMYWMWHQFSRQLVYNIEKTYKNSKKYNNRNNQIQSDGQSDGMESVLGTKIVEKTKIMENLIKNKEITARGAASTLLQIILKN